MSLGLGYLIGGSFWPFLSIAVGSVLVLRGHFPNWFAHHIEEQPIAGIPYQRRESYRRWSLVAFVAVLLASAASFAYTRAVPQKPDLSVAIRDAIREELNTKSEIVNKEQRREGNRAPAPPRFEFKDSPFFTGRRKSQITAVLTDVERYLSKLGVSIGKPVPPIGVLTRKGSNTSINFGNDPYYYDSLNISEEFLDNRTVVIHTYISYTIETLFNPRVSEGPTPFEVEFDPSVPAEPVPERKPSSEEAKNMREFLEHLNHLSAEQIAVLLDYQREGLVKFMAKITLSQYLTDSYRGSCDKCLPIVCPATTTTTKANSETNAGSLLPAGYLWEIRNKYGIQFTDQLAAFTIRAIIDRPFEPTEKHFNMYFASRLRIAEHVIDNEDSKAESIKGILSQCAWLPK